MNDIVREIGPLDGIAHCAGMESIKPLQLVNSESFRQTMDINVASALALSKAFRRKGNNHGGGSIVFISSVAGLVGQVGHVEYCSSKAALIGLCKSLALKLARVNIRVNCIAPGLIRTELVERSQKTLSAEQLEAIEAYHPLCIGKPRDVSNE